MISRYRSSRPGIPGTSLPAVPMIVGIGRGCWFGPEMCDMCHDGPMPTALDEPALVPDAGVTFGQMVRLGAALATAGAGFLHLDAAGDHTGHAHIAGFFVAIGVGQLAGAVNAARR